MLASCFFETGRETEEKKLKSPSLNTPPSLREIIINNSSLVLWKMLNDRNGTSHGRQKGILMEYKNNNALLLLMATINSFCCVRYGPSCLRHRNYFFFFSFILDTGIISYNPIKYSCPYVAHEKFDANRFSLAQQVLELGQVSGS